MPRRSCKVKQVAQQGGHPRFSTLPGASLPAPPLCQHLLHGRFSPRSGRHPVVV